MLLVEILFLFTTQAEEIEALAGYCQIWDGQVAWRIITKERWPQKCQIKLTVNGFVCKRKIIVCSNM